jgi:hypothetical protein
MYYLLVCYNLLYNHQRITFGSRSNLSLFNGHNKNSGFSACIARWVHAHITDANNTNSIAINIIEYRISITYTLFGQL